MSRELTPITCVAELKALQELYRKDCPKHCVGYFWLDNYLRWMKRQPRIRNLSFYTLNGDWRSDGLFILVHRYQLYFSNLSKQPTPELLAALSLLDWSRGFKVSALHEAHHAIFKLQLQPQRLVMEREMKTRMYSLPCERAKQLQLSCPSGYKLDSVRLEHAELVNGLWSARHPGSLQLIRLLIENNISVGVYEVSTGQLCAWCLRLQSGFLGALEVLDTHQRRGLGLLVATAIAKLIADEMAQDVTALVNTNNAVACKVFDKLRFTLLEGEHYYWSMCFPTGMPSVDWPLNE